MNKKPWANFRDDKERADYFTIKRARQEQRYFYAPSLDELQAPEREQREIKARQARQAELAKQTAKSLQVYHETKADREQAEREQNARELVDMGKKSLLFHSYMEDVLDEYWKEYLAPYNEQCDRTAREKAIDARQAERKQRKQTATAERASATADKQTATAERDNRTPAERKKAERKKAKIMQAFQAERAQVQAMRQAERDSVKQAEQTARDNRQREQEELDEKYRAIHDSLTIDGYYNQLVFPFIKQTAKQTRLRYRDRDAQDIIKAMDADTYGQLEHTAKIIVHQAIKTIYQESDKAPEKMLNLLYIDSAKLLRQDAQAWTAYCEEYAEQEELDESATEYTVHDRTRVNLSKGKSFMIECTPWAEQTETEYNKLLTINYAESALETTDLLQNVLQRMTELYYLDMVQNDADIWTAIKQRKQTAKTAEQEAEKARAKKLVNLVYASANSVIKREQSIRQREQRDTMTDRDSEQDSATKVYEIDAQDGRKTDGYTIDEYKRLNAQVILDGLTDIIKQLYNKVNNPALCAQVILAHGDGINNSDIGRAYNLNEKQVRRYIVYGERIANSEEALKLVYELATAL